MFLVNLHPQKNVVHDLLNIKKSCNKESIVKFKKFDTLGEIDIEPFPHRCEYCMQIKDA